MCIFLFLFVLLFLKLLACRLCVDVGRLGRRRAPNGVVAAGRYLGRHADLILDRTDDADNRADCVHFTGGHQIVGQRWRRRWQRQRGGRLVVVVVVVVVADLAVVEKEGLVATALVLLAAKREHVIGVEIARVVHAARRMRVGSTFVAIGA